MQSAAFVVPGPFDARTGGSIYDRRIVEGLRERGWSIDVHELPNRFPFPDTETLTRADDVLAGIPDGTLTLVDGLAFGAMPDIAERHALRLRLAPIVHLPLAFEVGLDAPTAFQLETSERRALATARLVIVTGPPTIDLLRSYDVPADRIAVVAPGTDRAPLARGSGNPVELLCVATLNPGKAHDALVQALASCSSPWHLTCAGSLSRHPATAGRTGALVDELGLAGRVTFAGDLDAPALEAAYDRADVFVLATRRETYGMAVAEALAHGLPVVSTRTGAIPDLIGRDAGIVVTPGDIDSLRDALTRVIADAEFRARLRAGAARARERLRTWADAAATMAGVLDRVGRHG